MNERRKNERRRWGRKVTYPFIDSDGVLVTKNRRRKVDRREVEKEEVDEQNESSTPTPAPVSADAKQKSNNTSLDISESKVQELEQALKDEEPASSNITSSIKDLEDQILDATNLDSVTNVKLDEDIALELEEKTTTPSTVVEEKQELPEPDLEVNGAEPEASIELSVKGEKHVVKGEKESCQVGRDPSCDIVVQGKFVSRAHAKIMFKDGKFFLEDNSFNGTYIKFDNGQKIHVSKDEQTLVSNGVMSMGKPVDDDSKSVIAFKISQ